jgi:hypothetical protein
MADTFFFCHGFVPHGFRSRTFYRLRKNCRSRIAIMES